MSLLNSTRIAELNDILRVSGPFMAVQSGIGQWVFTAGIVGNGPQFVAAAIHAVQTFNDFSKGNDPYGEHNFGSLEIFGQKLFWKIDYYALDLQSDSPDPTDPKVTARVMTIMLPSEY